MYHRLFECTYPALKRTPREKISTAEHAVRTKDYQLRLSNKPESLSADGGDHADNKLVQR